MTSTKNVTTGWNEDHTQYTDSLGHTYPKTGEAWDDSDKEAYAWEAFITFVINNASELADQIEEWIDDYEDENGTSCRPVPYDRSATNMYDEDQGHNDAATEFRVAIFEDRYEDAARIYDDVETAYSNDYFPGWKHINNDAEVTMFDEESEALESDIPAIDDSGMVYDWAAEHEDED